MYFSDPPIDGVIDSMEVFDPVSGEWSVAAALSTARCQHCCTALDGKLYVAGGYAAENLNPR